MSAAEVQALLRFLSQDAKVPLATAIAKVKELQSADLGSPEKLAKLKAAELATIFSDEKVCKQIVAAAKRVAKKRAAGDEGSPSTPKKQKKESLFADDVAPTADLEETLALPASTADEDELLGTVVFTNRAPLVLAFVVTLLKYSMPAQPLSSRLSLAQAYVSSTSRARAVNLGIESGKSAEEEGYGEGQPTVTIMGKQLYVLRRWGYEWKRDAPVKTETVETQGSEPEQTQEMVKQEEPALWALDLEALKKSNTNGPSTVHVGAGAYGSMPIYTPQSARAYLVKSFDVPPPSDPAAKKLSATARAAEKDRNLGKLLHSLDLVYESWKEQLSAGELDKRTWNWYVKVRPDVEHGVAGWGGKNQVKLADILALRR